MTDTTRSGIQAVAFPRAGSRQQRLLTPKLLLIVPTLVLLAAFFIIPYVNMVVMSFRSPSTTGVFAPGYTFANYAKALGDTYYLLLLGQTLWLGLVISVICLVVGYPVAYHLARTRSRYKGLLYAGVLAPLLVGVVIRCYGWTILLANNGLINQSVKGMGLGHGLKLMYNSLGVSIGLVHVFLPFMILPLLSTIQSIDPRLEEAARSLGASRMRAFFRVTFPLSLPGIQSGVVLVFMLTISAYVIPVLLGAMRFKIMPTIVIQLLIDAFLWPFGAALALILSVSGAICVLFFVQLTGRFMRGVT
jgi:putative spermidine/putrescine transport system permease protein